MIRLELKWLVRPDQQLSVFKEIAERGYRPLFPVRQISSIYFDDNVMTNYIKGEEGVVPREKFRRRWYGPLQSFSFDSSRYEVKQTGEWGRQKWVEGHSGADQKVIDTYKQKFQASILRPVSLVSYKRHYFSNENGVRLTFDQSITYRRVTDIAQNKVSTIQYLQDENMVLELKAPRLVSAMNHADSFSFSRSRFSKYGHSIEHLGVI